ncbi:MAG: KTSC domain-containing protein [Pseudomonadota bacterium]
MRPISSSAIAYAGYDKAARILRLRYTNGRTYDYFAVPASVWVALLSAESAGEFANDEIKPHYAYSEVVQAD